MNITKKINHHLKAEKISKLSIQNCCKPIFHRQKFIFLNDNVWVGCPKLGHVILSCLKYQFYSEDFLSEQTFAFPFRAWYRLGIFSRHFLREFFLYQEIIESEDKNNHAFMYIFLPRYVQCTYSRLNFKEQTIFRSDKESKDTYF